MTWREPDERLAETCQMLEQLIQKKECPNKKLLASFARNIRARLLKPETITNEVARAAKLMLVKTRMGIRYRKLRKAGRIPPSPFFESTKGEFLETANSTARELRKILQRLS